MLIIAGPVMPADEPCLWCRKPLAGHSEKAGQAVPRMGCLGLRHFMLTKSMADLMSEQHAKTKER